LTGRFTGRTGQAWRLHCEVDGRRRLYDSDGQPGPWASISHDGPWVAAAVSARPLGLDLTLMHRQRDWPRIARGMFTPSMAEALAALPEDRQQADLCRHWALREAWSKRSGLGLQRSRSRRLLTLPCEPDQAAAWTWPVDGGFLALAAAAGGVPEGLAAPTGYWRYSSPG